MMNMSLPSRFAAPYPMSSLPASFSTPWSSLPFRSPFAAPVSYPTASGTTIAVPKYPYQQPSFSNMRYNSLKQSRSFNRPRRSSKSIDGFSTTSTRRPSRTKSISQLKSLSDSSSSVLPRAQSWHSMGNVHSVNYSVAYAAENHLTPKSQRKRSMRRKKASIVPPVPLSPQRRRQGSFRKARKPSIPLPERGVVRISTLDELPMPVTPRFKRRNSLNTDRLSTKGSVAASSIKRQTKCRNQSIQTQTMKSKDDNEKGFQVDLDDDIRSVSSVSSNTSASSIQQQINSSLRNDPCITAAMEEFRQHRRNSDHNVSPVSPHVLHRHRSRERVQSDSTIRSATPSVDRSRSRSHSQSSFTSVERSEIRQFIKSIKSNETQSVESVSRSSSIPPAPPIENSIPVNKPKRSLVTEELDREFSKLRALADDDELNYVTPSSFCKRKKSTKDRPAPTLPPLPTFSDLLRKVQLRPVDKSALTKPLTIEEPLKKFKIDSIPPVVVPQSSPIPPYESLPDDDVKHEYAKPMKKPVEQTGPPAICRFQPLRSLSPRSSEKNYSQSFSTFDRFQKNSPSNSFPTTFQPTPTSPPPSTDYATTSVNENIYASDIDVHLPVSTVDKEPIDDLQIHLENQTILTDYYYSDYDLKAKETESSSVLHDLTRVFRRKHEQKIRLTPAYSKHSRCSIM